MDHRDQREKYLQGKLGVAESTLRNMFPKKGIVKRNLEYSISILKEEIKKARSAPIESWDMKL